jgi:hypothetical protein
MDHLHPSMFDRIAARMQRASAGADPASGPRAAPQATRLTDDTGFALVDSETRLGGLPEIERYLPDILGRAMARGWIDPSFRDALASDAKGLLLRYGIHLPDSIGIEIEPGSGGRERVVVYDTPPGGPRRRLLYLQLVMMAGR